MSFYHKDITYFFSLYKNSYFTCKNLKSSNVKFYYSQKSLINEHGNHFKSIIVFNNILKNIEQKENENPNLSKSEVEKIIFNSLVNDKK